jgi:tRNA(Ser,Leu) C12 N-acetylase TAN1
VSSINGLKKCNFLQTETTYLGFVINSKDFQPHPEKVEVIKSLQQPTTVKQVRSIIGTCSYYRRFIANFSEIAESIIKLTRKYIMI